MRNLVVILLFLFLIVLSVFGIPALLELTLGTEQPILTVTSSSMWPELNRGDIVFVKETNIEDIEIGSVIVFNHENGLAVHRVIQIGETRITTKGDANPIADFPIKYDDVVGRVPTIGSKLIKLPWVGHFSLTEETEEGAAAPGNMVETGFWQQLGQVFINPVSIVIMIVVPLFIIFQNRISVAVIKLLPKSIRKRRLRARNRRMPERSR